MGIFSWVKRLRDSFGQCGKAPTVLRPPSVFDDEEDSTEEEQMSSSDDLRHPPILEAGYNVPRSIESADQLYNWFHNDSDDRVYHSAKLIAAMNWFLRQYQLDRGDSMQQFLWLHERKRAHKYGRPVLQTMACTSGVDPLDRDSNTLALWLAHYLNARDRCYAAMVDADDDIVPSSPPPTQAAAVPPVVLVPGTPPTSPSQPSQHNLTDVYMGGVQIIDPNSIYTAPTLISYTVSMPGGKRYYICTSMMETAPAPPSTVVAVAERPPTPEPAPTGGPTWGEMYELECRIEQMKEDERVKMQAEQMALEALDEQRESVSPDKKKRNREDEAEDKKDK